MDYGDSNKCILVAYILLFAANFRETEESPYISIYPKRTEHTPKFDNDLVPLYFGLMLSLTGDHQSSGALAGVQAALDKINSRDELLPGYSLHYTLTDSKV